ncbi:MAG: hypothetical protein K6B15_02980 [Parasporobacterium sp.]|nr:hypothetical protein [Parasporobacterium sp.]
MLPKPSMLAIPTCNAPLGMGLGACNSNNKCDDQACDNGHTEGSSTWEVIKECGTTIVRMATIMGLFM